MESNDTPKTMTLREFAQKLKALSEKYGFKDVTEPPQTSTDGKVKRYEIRMFPNDPVENSPPKG